MRHFLVTLLAALTLALSGCGYNTFQSTEEQIKASWSEVLNLSLIHISEPTRPY